MQWGVHPTFRLPEEPGAFEIGFGGDVTAFTYPGFFEAGVSRVAHGRTCAGIGAVPMLDGSVQSFASLPLPFDTEELLLVAGHKGVARLTNRAEGYRVVMEWDPDVFPGVLLWVSNRGRRYAPWNGRHLGLGVEPVCAPFDLGYAHAVNPSSPLRAQRRCDRDPLFAGARPRDELPVPVRERLKRDCAVRNGRRSTPERSLWTPGT